ncbi:MAG: SBBP repeat-containing protein, partial [Bacteroidia bacterium]|nr:SBBP repeat-containing protein [Bacteroidia bacterium]
MYSVKKFAAVRVILLLIFTSASVYLSYAGNTNSEQRQPSADIKHTQSVNKTAGSSMLFTPNKGQIIDIDGHLRPDILFKGNSDGAAVYLRKSGISYVRSNGGEVMHEIEEEVEEKIKQSGTGRMEADELRQELMHRAKVHLNRLDIDFVNANTNNVEIETAGQSEGYTNYYYAHCPQGITNVFSYNTVIRKNIYEGIDVKYYASTSLSAGASTSCLPAGTALSAGASASCLPAGKALSASGGEKQGLKYDIVVNPGADPGQIKLKYSGHKSIRINNGKLLVETDLGNIEESLPRVYQLINGQVVDVSCGYVLAAKDSNGNKESEEAIVSFKFETLPDGRPGWNRNYPLIIDPFIWATYYGGADTEYSTDIAVDANGNTFITGGANNLFPIGAAPGNSVFQAFYVLSTDAIVVKFSPNGLRLWATYYGGSGSTTGNSIATDLSNNVVITGNTNSTGFPVGSVAGNSVFQSAYGAGANSNAIVVKFTSNGTRLWATYYGGLTLGTTGYGITTDNLGNVAITGYTTSPTIPIGATGGNSVFQPASGGTGDIFVVKFDPT